MKMLMHGLTLAFAVTATDMRAEAMVTVNGTELAVSELMENCKSITGDPAAQLGCFTALSELLEEQNNPSNVDPESVSEAFERFRSAAEHLGSETGLSIVGDGCNLQLTYFANYFHISRRNISTIDLYSAQFDASNLQIDQTRDGSGPFSDGRMEAGKSAVIWGGEALESSEHNFTPKSARTAMDVYAQQVVQELNPQESEAFQFVLVHPEKSDVKDEIWSAFQQYVEACQG